MGILKRFLHDKVGLICASVMLCLFLLAAFAEYVVPYDPYEIQLRETFLRPSIRHWCGTDQFGRDILSRTILATQVTTRIVLSAILSAMVVGVPIGMLVGFIGGKAEFLVMRLTDFLLIFPPILVAITIMSISGPTESGLVFALAAYVVPQMIRLSRGATLSAKQELYIEACRAIGVSTPRILLRHIWPNISAPIIVQATLMLPVLVLSAAALSFLGLGVPPPTPEWGAMLSQAKGFMRFAPHLLLGPAIALLVFVFASNLLGDSLQELVNPRSGRR